MLTSNNKVTTNSVQLLPTITGAILILQTSKKTKIGLKNLRVQEIWGTITWLYSVCWGEGTSFGSSCIVGRFEKMGLRDRLTTVLSPWSLKLCNGNVWMD